MCTKRVKKEEYEEDVCGANEGNEEQLGNLDAVFKQQCRPDVGEDLHLEQQEPASPHIKEEEEPEPSHIKEEEEELDTQHMKEVKEPEPLYSRMAKKRKIEDALNVITDGSSSDIEQLGEDDDGDEEWTTASFEESTDNNEDEGDPEEDTKKAEDARQKQSGRSKAKKQYQWIRKAFEPPVVDFVECVEEDSKERLDWTPYMYFKDFVTEEMLEEVALETNVYSVQKEEKLVNTNAKEMEQVLGMYMHMGLVQMPNQRAYWELETEYPVVCHVMSRERFHHLLALIHFCDNHKVSEYARRDKLWKLRPWLEKLRQRFLLIAPEECHAVGEMVVPFNGKSSLRCYMPDKLHKWGFKMWGRVGQSGFLYDFDVCQGAENADKERSDVGPAGDVVLKMTSTLPRGRNHKVFAGDVFTTVPLAERLKQRGIYFIGAVPTNKVKSCQLMDEKEFKSKGRGCVDFRVNQDHDVVVRWYDGKAVNLLSSFVGVEPLRNVKRWDPKAKRHVAVPTPAIVDAYNAFVGGLVLFDMLSALYKYGLRSRRWYLYIWWHTVTVAVVNAWIRYRRDLKRLNPDQKPLPLRKFQASVATSLTRAGKANELDRALSSLEAMSSPPRKRKAARVPPDVRKDGLDHFPTWEPRQRCKFCTGHFSHVYCEKCRVHLCLNKERNCFQAFHHAK
ncbi:piggyBac transposable element-derived protein 2 [Festucalex cinctus]